MSDVVLIFPRTGMDEISRAPLSLLCLAATLENNGYSPFILDTRVEKKYRSILRKKIKDVICIGISSMSGFQISHGLEVSNYIKQIDPSIPIVWGGVHPTLCHIQTINDPRIDAVVRGEGEATFLELVQTLEKGETLKNVRGVTFKQNDKIIITPERPFLDLNKLPHLPYNLLDIKNYFIKDFTEKTLDFITSRGCPHRCTFCYNTKFNKNTWRCMKANRVLEEVESLASDYNLEGIRFEDDNFFVSKKRIEEICRGMIKLDLKWATNCRNDYFRSFDRSLLSLIRRSGCVELYLGAESGSQRILNLIKKDVTVKDIKKAATICKKFGIKPTFTFMLGFPTETKKDIQKTMQLIDEIKMINPNAEMGIYIYTPYPGTELYELCKKYGFNEPAKLEEWGNFFWSTLNIPWFDENYKQFLEVISYISWFALFSGLEARFKSKHLRVGAKILSYPAKTRWKYRFWKFPFELEVVKWYYKRGIVE